MSAPGKALLAIAFASVLVFAACGSDDTSPSANGATESPSEATGGDGGMSAGTADLITADIAFDPTSLSVASGKTIEISNEDAFEHTFTVDDTDVDVDLPASSDQQAKIDLDPGSYDFHCEIHPQMQGTLTVT